MSKAPLTQSNQNPGEMYFEWYLDELKSNGYLKDYSREPQTFLVLPPYVVKKEKQFATKPSVMEEFTLLNAVTYTYDYRLIWDESAIYVFTEPLLEFFKFGKPEFISHYLEVDGETELVSYVDVKPPAATLRFANNVSTSFTFPLIQKFIMAQYGTYINKIVPMNSGKNAMNTCLFAKTFTPNRYRLTDGGTQERKIPFKKRSIESFTKSRKGDIDRVLKMEAKKNSQQSLL